MNRFWLTLPAAACLLCALFAGCNASSNADLAGRWSTSIDDVQFEMQLTKDGKATLSSSLIEQPETGEWKIVTQEGANVTIAMKSPGEQEYQNVNVQIVGQDTVKMSLPGSSDVRTFKRLR